MELQFRRPDGSFVAVIGGLPYHVTAEDRYFEEASIVAAELGSALAFEPEPEVPEPTLEELMRWGANVIQRHLDATAQLRSYDSIHTAVGYRGDPNSAFAAEAEALFAWRSAVWTAGLAIMDEVADGIRPMPSEQQIIEALPAMVWPQ